MERVLIVSKTRMGTVYCVGGLALSTNLSVRLCLSPQKKFQPEDTPFTIGQIWNLEFFHCTDLIPPHVEDVVVTSKQLVGNVPDLRAFLLARVNVWRGGPDALFDGLLQLKDRQNAYITEKGPLPRQSTGYWLPDRFLSCHDFENTIRYGFVYSDGVKQTKQTMFIKYVGVEESRLTLSANTLLRVSLARWWCKPGEIEPKCYLQLSGWYL